MAFPSFSIVHIWLILHSPGCTMLGSELPLSNLTRFCTFWLMLGHDANLNICISHQPWRKCLTLLLFSLRYSCTFPLANTGPTTQVPGKQLAASLASPQAFQLGWATRHTHWALPSHARGSWCEWRLAQTGPQKRGAVLPPLQKRLC